MSSPSQSPGPAAADASDELLRALLSICDQGVWVVDAGNRTVLINRRMVELLGAAEAQFPVGEPLDLFTAPATATVMRKLRLRAMGVSDRYRVQVILPNGQRRQLEISGAPRYDSAGRYAGAIAVCADAEHAGAMERPRLAGSDELAVALAARTAMTARETEILQLLLAGDRVPTMARALFVTQSTVRNHLCGIFRKTGVHSQQELIMLLRPSQTA